MENGKHKIHYIYNKWLFIDNVNIDVNKEKKWLKFKLTKDLFSISSGQNQKSVTYLFNLTTSLLLI